MNYRIFVLIVAVVLTACGGSSDGESINSESVAGPFPAYSADQIQFLKDNAAREAVTVAASGLQYEEMIAADGLMPTSESMVTLDYVGTKIDGTEFDSSYSRGTPASFTLSGTIPGFAEGIQLMNVGSTYRFVVPSDLAYGEAGAGTFISPGDALIFVVELLEINS